MTKDLVVVNDSNRVVAKYRIVLSGYMSKTWYHSDDAAELLSALRRIPREFARIEVCYPNVTSGYVPFNNYCPREKLMLDIKEPIDSSVEENASRTLYIAPVTETVPQDGILQYTTVESVSDILGTPTHHVVQFRPAQLKLIELFRDYGPTLGVEFKVITGLPEAEYNAAFDDATWAFERVAYVPFIADLVQAADVHAALKAEEQGSFGAERASFTRTDGSVKAHTRFAGPNDLDEAVEEEEFKL